MPGFRANCCVRRSVDTKRAATRRSTRTSARDLLAPPGAQGEKGEKGDKGDKGDPGRDATVAPVTKKK